MSGNVASNEVHFDIGALLSESWNLFKDNVGILIGASVLAMVIIMAAGSFTMGIGNIVLEGPLVLGLVSMFFKVARRQPVEFQEMFSGFKRFLPAFMASLLISVFSLIGFILCIIPGIFVSIVYSLTYNHMADQNLDFWPSMEASRTTVMANLGQWVLLWLVLIGINIVGMIPCGLGLLVTGPMSGLMVCLAYDQVIHGGVPQDDVQAPV